MLDTKDGRTVVGIVKKQDDTAVTIVTNTETVVFDLLGKAGTDDFKVLSRLLK